jgi:hypothetical protein
MALTDRELEELAANVLHERRKNASVKVAFVAQFVAIIFFTIFSDKLFIALSIIIEIVVMLVLLVYYNYPNFLKRKVKLMGKKMDHSGP